MIPIKVPPLGESIVEATISRWLRKEGEAVAAGDALVELETDKITVEVPALKAGVLTKRLRAEGDVVKVDELLGELDETADVAAAAPAGTGEEAGGQRDTATPGSAGASGASGAAGSATPATPATAAAPASPAREAQEPKASPAARRVAEQSGIDLGSISGTGRDGVVSKPDLIEQAGRPATQRTPAGKLPAVSAPTAEPAPAPAAARTAEPAPEPATTPTPTPDIAPAPAQSAQSARETREKMSTRRKRIAENLLQSQHSTAHLTTFNEVDMSAVMQLRDRHKARVEKEHGVKLTFMPFFVKAACLALKSNPAINAVVDGDSIVYRHYVNMGVAVASEAGLVVPNIRDADRRNMVQLSRDIFDVATRARDSKLTMDDLTGGTFTITNGGVFGSLLSTPILNYPQSGILGLHKIEDRPVAIDGRVEIRPMMYLALTYDHRIVEGQNAVQFLVRVKELMEDPAAMIID